MLVSLKSLLRLVIQFHSPPYEASSWQHKTFVDIVFCLSNHSAKIVALIWTCAEHAFDNSMKAGKKSVHTWLGLDFVLRISYFMDFEKKVSKRDSQKCCMQLQYLDLIDEDCTYVVWPWSLFQPLRYEPHGYQRLWVDLGRFKKALETHRPQIETTTDIVIIEELLNASSLLRGQKIFVGTLWMSCLCVCVFSSLLDPIQHDFTTRLLFKIFCSCKWIIMNAKWRLVVFSKAQYLLWYIHIYIHTYLYI